MERDNGPRIIAAIDFNDTLTSVSFLRHSGNISRGHIDTWEALKELHSVYIWPPKDGLESAPSRVAYSPTSHGYQQWGYDTDPDPKLCDSLRRGIWSPNMKIERLGNLIEFLRQTAQVGFEHDIPGQLGSSPEELAKDFLRQVARQLRSDILRCYGRSSLETWPVDLAFTHPTQWPLAARRQYYKVLRAVFDSKTFPTIRDFYFVDDLESDTLCGIMEAVTPDRWHRYQLYPDDVVIACHTADDIATSTALRVRTTGLENKPISLSKAVSGPRLTTLAGPKHISHSFRLLLSERLGPETAAKLDQAGGRENPDLPSAAWEKLTSRFIPIVYSFSGQAGVRYPIQLPYGIEHHGSGIVNLESDDIKQIFSSSISNLESLILLSINATKKPGSNDEERVRPKAVSLSGMLSESPYVSSCLSEFVSSHGIQAMIRHGSESGERQSSSSMDDSLDPRLKFNSRAQGAVVHMLGGLGVDPHPLKQTACSYGIAVSKGFNPVKHSSEDMQTKPVDMSTQAKAQITWLFNKGQLFFPDRTNCIRKRRRLLRKFRPADITANSAARITLVISSADRQPKSERLDDLEAESSRLIHLDYKLGDIPKKQRQKKFEAPGRSLSRDYYFQAVLTLDVSLYDSEFVVRLTCGEDVELAKQSGDMEKEKASV